MSKVKVTALQFSNRNRRDIRTQFGAICWRRNKKGKIRILLVTTRGTGRWIVPKGWPMPGRTPEEAAAGEAFEEAGVSGTITGQVAGLFAHTKTNPGANEDLPCVVALYPLKVKKKHVKYPEKGQRKRKWMSPKKAAKRVEEPELKDILRNFDPELGG